MNLIKIASDYCSLHVTLTPKEEQAKIVRCVESLLTKSGVIEVQDHNLKAKIEDLPQAMLAKAFRGKLVAQLPGDGDSRDLLEKIKALRAGLEKKRREK